SLLILSRQLMFVYFHFLFLVLTISLHSCLLHLPILLSCPAADASCTDDFTVFFKWVTAAKYDNTPVICRVQSVKFTIRHCRLCKIRRRHFQCNRSPCLVLCNIKACNPRIIHTVCRNQVSPCIDD